MEYKKKFIAYVDILGFKQMVEASESGNELSLDDILQLLALLRSGNDLADVRDYGPVTCPESKHIDRHLDFEITQVSDSLIVSIEQSPAGAINVIDLCCRVVLRLLKEGRMCRGYITLGNIYHNGNTFVGTGYQRAYFEEKYVKFRKGNDKSSPPFIEIDPAVCTYLKSCGDQCVQEMFHRLTRCENGLNAIFPFGRFSDLYGGILLDADNDQQRKIIRGWIHDFIRLIKTGVEDADSSATEKANHYINILNDELAKCDRNDDLIDILNQPFPRKRPYPQ